MGTAGLGGTGRGVSGGHSPSGGRGIVRGAGEGGRRKVRPGERGQKSTRMVVARSHHEAHGRLRRLFGDSAPDDPCAEGDCRRALSATSRKVARRFGAAFRGSQPFRKRRPFHLPPVGGDAYVLEIPDPYNEPENASNFDGSSRRSAPSVSRSTPGTSPGADLIQKKPLCDSEK